jgi:elongator complex protein 3
VRVNRIQRDFKKTGEGYTDLGYTSENIMPNLAQIVKDEAEKLGVYCQCIRCCEIQREKFNPDEVVYEPLKFRASGADEYFIRAIIQREHRPLLLGFIRLRLSYALEDSIIPELKGTTAMIRELHVYGSINKVGTSNNRGAQHLGIGKKLLSMAEDIAIENKFDKMAVISGIGVRDYYRKNGYERSGSYMIKSLHKTPTRLSTLRTFNLKQVDNDSKYGIMFADLVMAVFVIIGLKWLLM